MGYLRKLIFEIKHGLFTITLSLVLIAVKKAINYCHCFAPRARSVILQYTIFDRKFTVKLKVIGDSCSGFFFQMRLIISKIDVPCRVLLS